jgi:serine/threonine protein kinase
MLSHLGSGQFGSVELGEWDNESKTVNVALKKLNEGATLQDTVKFLQEAATMAQFHHPNVITLHGVVVSGTPVSECHGMTQQL